MRAGLLHYRVNVKRPSYSVDQYGDRIRTLYELVNDVWANVKFIGTPSAGASEEEINDQTTGKIKIEVTCRYFGLGDQQSVQLRFDDVIEFEEGIFDIYSIHIIGRKELYKIRAEYRDDLSNVRFYNQNAPDIIVL
jgi:head-tail adaptor